MDKQWKNLGMIIVIVLIIAIGYFLYTNYLPKVVLASNTDLLAESLVKNDLNYSDIKLTTELFSYSLDKQKAAVLLADKSTPADVITAVHFDEAQTKIIDDYQNLVSDENIVYCERLEELDSIRSRALDLVLNMQDTYSASNALGIDMNAVQLGYSLLSDDIDAANDLCFSIVYSAGGA